MYQQQYVTTRFLLKLINISNAKNLLFPNVTSSRNKGPVVGLLNYYFKDLIFTVQ